MPASVLRHVATDPDELLTTGEAAAILGSTRQHVVDLCARGDLPYSLAGRHRRVRRSDVEAVRGRSDELTSDQQRSLWLAYAVGGKVVADPDRALTRARRNLATMRSQPGSRANRWLDDWEQLLDGPLDRLLDQYTSRSTRGRDLRQNAPFAGLLSEQERARVLAAWRAANRA